MSEKPQDYHVSSLDRPFLLRPKGNSRHVCYCGCSFTKRGSFIKHWKKEHDW